MALNDACAASNNPWVMGGVLRFFGQVMTILPGKSACLRCLVGEEGANARGLDCGDAGVFGAVGGFSWAWRRPPDALRVLKGLEPALVEQADDGRFMEKRRRERACGPEPGLSRLRARRARANENPRAAGSAPLGHDFESLDERMSPMKISTKGRYAVLAMIELARHSQTHPVPLPPDSRQARHQPALSRTIVRENAQGFSGEQHEGAGRRLHSGAAAL